MRSSILCAVVCSSSLAAAVFSGGCTQGSEGTSTEGANPGAAVQPPAPAVEPTAEPVPDDWETFADDSTGVSFRYPPDLGTTYVRALDWPPQPLLEAGPFDCTEAGEETARAGRTELTTIGDRTYCVTRVTEGAAGSVYTMYAYAMPLGNDVVILTFSTRAPQCGNYDEPARSECERERASFSMDPIVDAIARTVRVPSGAGRGENPI